MDVYLGVNVTKMPAHWQIRSALILTSRCSFENWRRCEPIFRCLRTWNNYVGVVQLPASTISRRDWMPHGQRSAD